MKELIYLEGIIQSVAGVVVGGGRFDVLSLKFGLQIGIYYSHKASLAAQLVKNLPAMWETWVGKIPWRKERLPTPVFWPGEFHGLQHMGLQRAGHD